MKKKISEMKKNVFSENHLSHYCRQVEEEEEENEKKAKMNEKHDTSCSKSKSYSDYEREEEEFTSSSSQLESDSDAGEDMKNDEERRKAKIRFLLGMPDSPMIDDKCKPESGPKGLREDNDVSYENVKTLVEKCFGIPGPERDGYVVHSYLTILENKDILKAVKHRLSCILKQMNCMGLLRFANTVTGGSIPFEKTRKKMKEVILERIRKMPRNPEHEDHKRFMEELPELLKNPCHFLETSKMVEFIDADFLCHDFLCHHCAAKKLLKGLESMDVRTLDAMKRRLKGIVSTPTFPCDRPSHDKTRVRDTVKRKFERFLDGKVCGRDDLDPRLAKAMLIGVLNLKMKNPKIALPEFYTFKEEFGLTYTTVTQDDLLRAIRILDGTKLDNSVTQELRSVLDPKFEMDEKIFRIGNIRNWLIEYLFECSEIDPAEFRKAGVPKVCDIIRYAFEKRIGSSGSVPCIEKEKAKEEAENVLAFSGQLKQIVLDYMPDHKMDEEFNDAYIKKMQLFFDEEFEDLKKDHVSHSDDESVGECEPDASVLAAELISGGNASKLEDLGQGSSKRADNKQIPVNKYLAAQEICDETSLLAHQFIGRSLEILLLNEGVELEESQLLYLRDGLCNQEDCDKNKKTHLNCASPNPGDKRKRSYISGSTSNPADGAGKYGSLNSKGSKSKAERSTKGKEKKDGKSKDTTPKVKSKLNETPRTQGDKVMNLADLAKHGDIAHAYEGLGDL